MIERVIVVFPSSFCRVVGFSPVHHSGFLQTTLSMFVGLVIAVVAVYTRQRTGLLMPREKLAQD